MPDSKVAVLLYGHLRTYKHCAPSLMNNICLPLDADVFLHSWRELDSNTAAWYPEEWKVTAEDGDFNASIEDAYQPISYQIDEPINHDGLKDKFLHDSDGKGRINLLGLYSCLTSLNRTMMLMNEAEQVRGYKYDTVIVTRPDILFMPSTCLFFRQNLSQLSSDTLNCGCISIDTFKLGRSLFIRKTAFDVVFWGRPDVVANFTDMVQSFDKLFRSESGEIYDLCEKGVFWPEVIYERYLVSKGIFLNAFDLEFTIRRKNNQELGKFRKLLSRFT